MKWFRPSKHDQELINLIKKSGGDFDFDTNSVKFRLLSSIRHADQKIVRHFRFIRVMQYSAGFAGLVVVVSTTFAFASNAKPGDTLFSLNKFGENFVLNLPLSVDQEIKIQEYIVANRLEALDQVQEAKKLEAVKESEESLNSAVNAVTTNKKKFEASGKTESAEKMEKVLDNLQTQAEKTEAKMQTLEQEAKDEETKAVIRERLKKLGETRKKARSEIKKYRTND